MNSRARKRSKKRKSQHQYRSVRYWSQENDDTIIAFLNGTGVPNGTFFQRFFMVKNNIVSLPQVLEELGLSNTQWKEMTSAVIVLTRRGMASKEVEQ